MKILQINCVYGTGSTGRLTQAIHTRLLAEGSNPLSAAAAALAVQTRTSIRSAGSCTPRRSMQRPI